jgi:Icc-related predicted phosphoesterase
MKILAIGDPHGSLDKVRKISFKRIDLILLTGDLGSANMMRKMAFENVERKKKGLSEKEYSPTQEKRAFMEAYNSSLKIIRFLSRKAPVFTIYGNVESSNLDTRRFSKKIGKKIPLLTNTLTAMRNVRVINNRLANFQRIRVGGLEYFVDTNWVRDFKPADYRKRMKKAKKATDKARRVLRWFGEVDILVCHQPPYGFLDRVGAPAPKHWRGKHAGSKVILGYIKKHKPKYVFCGHIHEGEGMKKIGKTEVHNLGVGGHKVIEL